MGPHFSRTWSWLVWGQLQREGPSLGHPGWPLRAWTHSEAQQKPQALQCKNP